MNRFSLLTALERLKTPDAAMAAGVALAIAAALMQFYRTEPMQAYADFLRLEAAAAKKNAGRLPLDVLQNEAPADETRLSQFYRHFPLRENAPDSLAVIYRAAEEQGLLLTEGSYQLIPVKALKLSAYQISLPVKGSYAQVRKFIDRLLSALPALSVDELSFSREGIATPQVDAKIRLTLYLQAANASQ